MIKFLKLHIGIYHTRQTYHVRKDRYSRISNQCTNKASNAVTLSYEIMYLLVQNTPYKHTPWE